jgi:hypothetical protein
MLAFAIALGWSLYQVAVSVGSVIALGVQHTDGGKPPLSLAWGDHIFYFEPLLADLIVLAVVLAVVLVVQRRTAD